VALDVLPGAGVDIVADAGDWDPGLQFDVVLCTEVLEHAPNAEQVVANAYRLLAPGGVFIMTCAAPRTLGPCTQGSTGTSVSTPVSTTATSLRRTCRAGCGRSRPAAARL
jgi:hypothetical protein